MIAAMFPGQGSQTPGMGKDLHDSRQEAREVFQRVKSATGIDVAKLCFDTDEETLRQTENAQIALFTCSMASWICLDAHLQGVVRVDFLAGHSVGEYAAIAASGSLSIEAAAKLVALRGSLMAEAGKRKSGTMAAVLGMERADLEKVCAATPGVVVVANDNCPGQLVISGELDAVAAAGAAATAKGAKRVLPLNVSGAFHSPLMEDASKKMGEALASVPFGAKSDVGSVYANVTSEAVGRVGDWPDLLTKQLKSPVRWTETIEHMARDGATIFVECGPGDVLSNLLKRIDRDLKAVKVNSLNTLEEAIGALRA